MFDEHGKDMYDQIWWCIEAGKHKERPNLHIHVLIDFKPMGSKHFLKQLKRVWCKHFPEAKYSITYNVDGNKGIHRVDCNTLEIQEDKVLYMDNDSKGSHENFIDLGLKGHRNLGVGG
jgi:hypothetical protein